MDTKPAKRYTPTEAAGIIGISPNSLRNWCATFGDHLSPGATPAPGNERFLNDWDIAILQRVKELRDAHRSYDAIKNELATMPIDTELAPYIDIQATATPPQPAPVATVGADVLQALQALADDRYSLLQQRVAEVEAKQRDGLTNFILGVIVGVLIVGVVWAIVMAGASLR